MNLYDFLTQFSEYKPRIVDSFDNQWPIFRDYHAKTYSIAFEGQNDNDCNVAITCQDSTEEIIEATMGFRDCRVIYVRSYDKKDYLQNCETFNVDAYGTKHVYEWGDYIPNVYIPEHGLDRVIRLYAEACDLGNPYYLNKPSGEVNRTTTEYEEPTPKKYRVYFNVRLDYEVEKAQNMDDALAQASKELYNDLDFMFDDDAIVVHERAVFETVNGDNHG